MEKANNLTLLALTPLIVAIAACSSGSSSAPSTRMLTIDPLTERLAQTIPTLDSSGIGATLSLWSDWDPNGDPSTGAALLARLFDTTIYGGVESVFFGAVMFDDVIPTITAVVPESALTGTSGSATRELVDPYGQSEADVTNWDISWQAAPASVALPTWIPRTAVTDFQVAITLQVVREAGDTSPTMSVTVYYQNDEIGDKMLFVSRPDDPNDTKCGYQVVYAERSFTGDYVTEIWSGGASQNEALEKNGDQTYLLLDDTSFSFKMKVMFESTEARLVFGGGITVFDDNENMVEAESFAAIRATFDVDSASMANDGAKFTGLADGSSYFVILSVADLNNAAYAGGGYPKLDTELAAETSAVSNYIKIGNAACQFDDLADLQSFQYRTLDTLFADDD